jgi:hypothetical protein
LRQSSGANLLPECDPEPIAVAHDDLAAAIDALHGAFDDLGAPALNSACKSSTPSTQM